MYHCTPHLLETTNDFPADEYSLFHAFSSKSLARDYMTIHWENFVTKADIQALKHAGITHIRVPVPHYIMGDILDDEPWIDGQWLYFVRMVGWARQYDLQVWIDLHTAPGSQNGFDNSGQTLLEPTCRHWSLSDTNIERTVKAIGDIAHAVIDDNLRDVVTGFGILNEPYMDCDMAKVKQFNQDALSVIRKTMGSDTAVYMADSFNATIWNNGWWTDSTKYNNTYLDSHFYHVFAEHERALSPKQHVAYTCAKLSRATATCCYQDPPKDTKVSQGISRIIGEWSAAFDTLPVERLNDIMKHIATSNGEALQMDRELSPERQAFLKQLVKAQMVVYENVDSGVSGGWFYWTLKMEGGAFAEWDFLRGVTEGWIPQLPTPDVDSVSVFGTCHEIAMATVSDTTIVHEYPDPQTSDTWLGPPIDDDYVIAPPDAKSGTRAKPQTHADTKNSNTSAKKAIQKDRGSTSSSNSSTSSRSYWRWFRFFSLVLVCCGIWHVFLKDEYGFGRARTQYTPLNTATHLNI
jgi:glucan 1,3-beta-glucosidase